MRGTDECDIIERYVQLGWGASDDLVDGKGKKEVILSIEDMVISLWKGECGDLYASRAFNYAAA